MKHIPPSALFLISFLLLPISIRAEIEPSWKNTLRDFSKESSCIPLVSSNLYFSLPKKVAEILETHSKNELMPFLEQLRSEISSQESTDINLWILVVRDGLHGKPTTQKSIFRDAKNKITKEVSPDVYDYTATIFHRHKTEQDAAANP